MIAELIFSLALLPAPTMPDAEPTAFRATAFTTPPLPMWERQMLEKRTANIRGYFGLLKPAMMFQIATIGGRSIGSIIEITPTPNVIFTFKEGGSMTINMTTGVITFSKNFKQDEAARQFWFLVARAFPYYKSALNQGWHP